MKKINLFIAFLLIVMMLLFLAMFKCMDDYHAVITPNQK